MSARTPKYSWAPPAASRKPTNTSSKISTMLRSVQTWRSCLQPRGIGGAVEMGLAGAVDQRGIAGRVGVGMQRLQRVDQHAGDVAPGPQHVQRPLRHLRQRIGLVRRAPDCRRRAARRPTSRDRRRRSAPDASGRCDSGPAAPPASPPRCPTCGTKPRRARKSRTAAAHCRRRPDGRSRAPGRARCARFSPRCDAFLVEVVAEDVDAVGAGEVVEDVAVEIGQRDAGRGLHEGAGAEIFAHQPLYWNGTR